MSARPLACTVAIYCTVTATLVEVVIAEFAESVPVKVKV
jgi:hypothetical protein